MRLRNVNRYHNAQVWRKDGPLQAARRVDSQLKNSPSCCSNCCIYPWPLGHKILTTQPCWCLLPIDMLAEQNRGRERAVVSRPDEISEGICLFVSLNRMCVCVFVCDYMHTYTVGVPGLVELFTNAKGETRPLNEMISSLPKNTDFSGQQSEMKWTTGLYTLSKVNTVDLWK